MQQRQRQRRTERQAENEYCEPPPAERKKKTEQKPNEQKKWLFDEPKINWNRWTMAGIEIRFVECAALCGQNCWCGL